MESGENVNKQEKSEIVKRFEASGWELVRIGEPREEKSDGLVTGIDYNDLKEILGTSAKEGDLVTILETVTAEYGDGFKSNGDHPITWEKEFGSTKELYKFTNGEWKLIKKGRSDENNNWVEGETESTNE